MQTGKDLGMQLMDQALLDSPCRRKEIDPDDAVTYATEKRPLQRLCHRHHAHAQARHHWSQPQAASG